MEQLKEKEYKHKIKKSENGNCSWAGRVGFIYDFLDKNINKNSRILDIGCYNGRLLKNLKKRGYNNLCGTDVDRFFKEDLFDFQKVDINTENLKWENGSFDAVIALQVLEHLENYFLVMKEVSRILKKGGFFIISIPNQFNIFYRFKFFLTGNMTGFEANNNHLLFLTKDVFEKTYLKDFQIVDTLYRRGPVPMLGRLNFFPGVNFPAKTRLLPGNQLFSDKVCYIMKKK